MKNNCIAMTRNSVLYEVFWVYPDRSVNGERWLAFRELPQRVQTGGAV